MEYRTLEITLQGAKHLKNVKLFCNGRMDVYAAVSIAGGDKRSRQKTKTPADRDGDSNPMWEFPMKFTVEEAALQQNRLTLKFKLKCARALGNRTIGVAHVPIKELLDSPGRGGSGGRRFVTYQVRKLTGKPKGELTFSYRFGDVTNFSATATPPPQQVTKVYGKPMAACSA